MPSVSSPQTDFTSGVIDHKLAAREDTKFYYNGLQDALNVEVQPQGGIVHRPGYEFIAELPAVLEAVDMSGIVFSAPHGGAVAALGGDDVMVTVDAVGVIDPYVVVQADCGQAIGVDYVDVIDVSLSSGVALNGFVVQYSDDAVAWNTLDRPFDVDASVRSRRRSGAVVARYWRVARVGGNDLGDAVVHLGGLAFFRQTSDLSEARLVPFAYSTIEAYMMVVGDKNISVLRDDSVVTHISVPHDSVHMDVLNYAQSLDTLVLFHPDVSPWRLYRQGSDDEFDFRNQEFESVPKYDYGAGVGGVDEVQLLNVSGLGANDKYNIQLEGERTGMITGTGEAGIQDALRGLSNTGDDGITVVKVDDGYEVTFGGDDGARAWSEMTISVHSGNGVWTVSRKVKGELPGEPIVSDDRGWFRCGVLNHDQRAIFGGAKGAPDAICFSRIDAPYDLEVKEDDETSGQLRRPGSVDQVSAIYQIASGRNLSIFTNDTEYYLNGRMSSDDVQITDPTNVGVKEGLRVFEVDGALIFLQGFDDPDNPGKQKATSVREFVFVDTEQSYSATNISVLASHLIKNPVDAALRKQVNTDDADALFMVNEDGTMTVLITLRSQSVTAFVPHATRAGDRFLAVGVDKKRRVYVVVERVIDGVRRRFIERRNQDLYFDCGSVYVPDFSEYVIDWGEDGQSVFGFDFDVDTPAGLCVRLNGEVLIEGEEYTVDLINRHITLVDPVQRKDVLRLSRYVSRIEGVGHLNGEVVSVMVDGSPSADVLVSDGAIDLEYPASMQVQYGFDYEVYGELMPLRVELPSGSSAFVKKRVFRLGVYLDETADILEFSVNGGEYRSLSLIVMDGEILDRSMMDLRFSGKKELRGLLGWGDAGAVKFRRAAPGPLNILSIVREVRL